MMCGREGAKDPVILALLLNQITLPTVLIHGNLGIHPRLTNEPFMRSSEKTEAKMPTGPNDREFCSKIRVSGGYRVAVWFIYYRGRP